MTPDQQRCRDCGTVHQTELDNVRCAHLGELRRDLHYYAVTLDYQPPTPAQVDDLWAHARKLGDDGEQAARWVKAVLSLGWRPPV